MGKQETRGTGPGRPGRRRERPVEFQSFPSAPVPVTLSAKTGGIAYVTRWPHAPSSRITSRLGFT